MWQELHAELSTKGFTVVSVALDSRDGAAQPWIDQADPNPAYPTLLDPFHHVADLFNLANVNIATWINEDGKIVRPPESAGVTEGFRNMDRKTGEVPTQVSENAALVRSVYHDALRDWVANGAKSEFALSDAATRDAMSLPTENTVQAHAMFVLGQYLIGAGKTDEGNELVSRASTLHPESWAIWRQGAPLDDRGLAATAEFWQRVDALGEKKYYEPVAMPGMPS